jgi:hypothetical protein
VPPQAFGSTRQHKARAPHVIADQHHADRGRSCVWRAQFNRRMARQVGSNLRAQRVVKQS